MLAGTPIRTESVTRVGRQNAGSGEPDAPNPQCPFASHLGVSSNQKAST
jgi:hypothetical protein